MDKYQRFDDGRMAALITARTRMNQPAQPISHRGYGNTSPDNYADTYWWIAGWNQGVNEKDCAATQCEICNARPEHDQGQADQSACFCETCTDKATFHGTD